MTTFGQSLEQQIAQWRSAVLRRQGDRGPDDEAREGVSEIM